MATDSQDVDGSETSVPTYGIDWPTRVIGDPGRWLEAGEYPEVCPSHDYLLSEGCCDLCATGVPPEKRFW